MTTRDFVGYGLNPPAVEWPNGARLAVSVVVNYEEGSEYSLLDGDPHGETMGEAPSPVPVEPHPSRYSPSLVNFCTRSLPVSTM